MKLSDYSDHIRLLIDKSFRNRLGRMGIEANKIQPIELIPQEYHTDRHRMDSVREVFISETGTVENAYEKLVEELTFTLFNRLAALKVMEAHTLFPEIITQRESHGGRSFAHLAWLEQNPHQRAEEAEGLVAFIENQFSNLSAEIPLFSTSHPYHLVPTAIELTGIISAFNQVENDTQVETDIWRSDDVLGWLYESYNNQKKADHKASGDKTEYNKVSIQSQVYTPRWVVKFLVDNSLGKLYLEMFPDSDIKTRYKIANAPATQTRERKPLTQIRLIDPATGSGNFLLYAFDLFYDLYLDQIENYGASYDENKIAKLIIENNLHGVDLDDRAIQLAQLGLYIKAKRRKRSIRIDHFNVVSSDFWLPEYEQVKDIFESNTDMDEKQKAIIRDIWTDLQQAYKFGSLIRLEEKLSIQLHGLKQQFDRTQLTMFEENTLANYEQFRDNFFANLQRAVEQNAAKQGSSFLNTKTQDAITFLQLLTQKYDVAVANPPYTDSSDFGAELKTFIDVNYKKPYNFSTNLYASFIKRCCELTEEDGLVGIIHPHTFMYIKTFEDVRKYMIEHTHIDLMVDYGLDRVNLFGTNILLEATWYVLSKTKSNKPGLYFNITANQQEKYKQESLVQAYNDAVNLHKNDRVYYLPQSKLKIIGGWPFIYWISDGFRVKFEATALQDEMKVCTGLSTANNNRFLRFWWEIERTQIGENWKLLAKGGPYNKWWGNIWLTVNWKNNGKEIREFEATGKAIRNESYYFNQGITNSLISVKGISNRILPENMIFDITAPSIFPQKYSNIYFSIGYLNTKIIQYIADCLNPTAALTWGDLQKIPFIKPSKIQEEAVSMLSKENVMTKKKLCTYKLIETNFENNQLSAFSDISLKDRVQSYLNYENLQLAIVLLNEAIINELIYEIYDLSDEDRLQVETKMGLSVGAEGISAETLAMWQALTNEELGITAEIRTILDNHIAELPIIEFEEDRKREIIDQMATLYQSNNDLEEFCIRNKVNPLDVCLWFNQNKVLPQARAAEITLEFLADAIRTILMEDEDGIVPLVGLPGEPRLLDRLEQHCLATGFTSAQFMQLDSLLGRPVNEYIEQYFFKNLSDHLNLFMYLPKTPFIWHLSSGVHQGFEAYIIIYKWNRDSLFKIKSQYLRDRVESLDYRLINLQGVETAAAQNEKETIRLQLREIEHFTAKIDELIAEGYNPILDDGVGKNIAPLQKKGMLKAEVLKANQLVKYLNADW
jgi:hypothetical protein